MKLNTVLMNSPFRGLSHLSEVYFIGIGGIGMSAIARFFQQQGVKVSGYDKTPTTLTRELEASGIAVHYEEKHSVDTNATRSGGLYTCHSKRS
ncbi:MAG: Mur ligase domain-containing protein [Chitinophagaceae bacterium]|nr:Mur ligase domain-containing protein [Chitinophagaceae bacterium]